MEREMPHVEGVEHRFVEANGTRIHVAEAGSGDPVLLLHGWPQHWYEWRQVIPPLAERYRVICPDLRGFGWSDAPGGSHPDNFIADNLALLDELGHSGPIRIMGHDWGGWTGFLIALFHPQRVRRLLALSITHPFPSRWAYLRSGTPLRFWYQWANSAPGLGPLLSRWASKGNPVYAWIGAGAWSKEEREIFLSQFHEKARAKAAQELYRHALFREAPRTITEYGRHRLKPPTLLLFGVRDRPVAYRLAASGFQSHADDMRVDPVPDSGHFIVDEQPELVIKRALAFFAEY